MTIKSVKLTVVLTVILLSFCTNEVLAQYELVLSSGVTLPREPVGWQWNTGYNFGVELILPKIDPNFVVSVDLNAFGFSVDRGNFEEFVGSEQILNNN